jgi:ABC-2 type transport system permease protein
MASKTWLVAQREYLENVRTKTFWIGILAFPAIFVIAIGVAWLMQKTKSTQRYTVLDYTTAGLGAEVERAARENEELLTLQRLAETSDLPDAQKQQIQALTVEDYAKVSEFAVLLPQNKQKQLEDQRKMLQGLAPGQKFAYTTPESLGLGDGSRDEQIRRANQAVQEGRLFAYFLFDADPVESFEERLRYVSNNLTDDDLRDWYQRATTIVVRKKRIAKANIEPAQARWIQESARFVPDQVTADLKTAKVKTEEKANKFAPIAFVYMLWIAVFTAAQMLLTNTVEEKSNRIIEVLLSSVSPGQLMSGKIWGIALTGLTVVGSWVAFTIVGVLVAPRLLPELQKWDLAGIVGDPLYLTSFLGYFLTGYLLFAAILVAIGSVCNSLKEAQNLLQPVFLLLMIPLLAMVPVVQEPNGVMARVFTYIPIYTPFAMMNRASGPPPAWEYVATTVLILVSVWLAFKAAGKVFRIGVLMTGKPPKLKEILGWLREK